MITMRTSAPSIVRQLRRRAGIPKNSISARIAPPPAPSQPLPGPIFGLTSSLLVAPVVVTVTVPVAVPELSVSGDDGPVQEGRSLAPLGEEVSAQLNVTVPA
jgi:hypothetical protein